MSHRDRPVVVVDVASKPGRSFRLIPSAVQSFAVNMLLGNMDLDDFADNADADGVFRGFGRRPDTVPSAAEKAMPARVDRGWTLNRPDAPLPGDYNPNVSYG